MIASEFTFQAFGGHEVVLGNHLEGQMIRLNVVILSCRYQRHWAGLGWAGKQKET